MNITIKMSEITPHIVESLNRLFERRIAIGHPENDWAVGCYGRSEKYKNGAKLRVSRFEFIPAQITRQFANGGHMGTAAYLRFNEEWLDEKGEVMYSTCGSCSAGMAFELLPRESTWILKRLGPVEYRKRNGKSVFYWANKKHGVTVRFVA